MSPRSNRTPSRACRAAFASIASEESIPSVSEAWIL